jgi:Leucine-rich repeat (LRR) protein
MKYFGLFSLLIVLVIGAIWNMARFTNHQSDGQDGQTTSYQDIINSAHDVTDGISGSGVVKIEIYDDIAYSSDSTQIDISSKNLSGSLKAEIRKLTDLEVLDVSNNNLTGLPAEVGQLSKLKILNISNNPLTGLPREIGNLQNLELLDLTGTQYSQEDLSIIEENLPDTTIVVID